MKNWIQKIGLGTVQFGLNYGINNSVGQVEGEEVKRILQKAQEVGIQTLDTARAYGNSEKVLGEYISNVDFFEIVSKFSKSPNEILNSLQFLKAEKLYGYLFHSFSVFLESPSFFDSLLQLKKEQKVDKIGFSLYYPHELEKLFDQNIVFDLVQIPYNIFDRRFEYLFPELKKRNIEVHVRSIFLQGLFFMPPEKLSAHFDDIKSKLRKLQLQAKEMQLSLATLPLYFVLQNSDIDKAILGVSSVRDLQENLKVVAHFDAIQKLNLDITVFEEDDQNIILPFLWKN